MLILNENIMFVNKNFLNLSRIIFSVSSFLNIKIDMNININDMQLINDYSKDNMFDTHYIDNDSSYKYKITNDTFRLILKEFFDLKKLINTNSNEKLLMLKPDVLETINKTYDNILFDEYYLFITNTLKYTKEIKISILYKRLSNSISVEDYDNCILIKKEINSLMN